MSNGVISPFLHNFISPQTGRILAPPGSVLMGNDCGIASPSSALSDLWLDFIKLSQEYSLLKRTDFIIGFPNAQLENAQVLNSLSNGFLYNNAGILSTLPTTQKLPLAYAATTENLSATYNNGDNGVGATLSSLSFLGFTVDGQTPPAGSIILVKDQTNAFQNGLYVLTDTGGLLGDWVLTRLDIYDQPGEIQKGDIVGVENGTLNAKTLWAENQNVLEVGTDSISFILFSSNYLLKDHLLIGNDDNIATPTPTILFKNLPNLTYKRIIRGDPSDRPIESDDLTTVENDLSGALDDIANLFSIVTNLVDLVNTLEETVADITEGLALIGGFAAIAALILSVASLGIRVGNLEDDVEEIQDDIDEIRGDIIVLQEQIAAVNDRIDNLSIELVGDVTGEGLISEPIVTELQLTLDQIKLAQNDVDFNNHKGINVINPNDPLDIVNLQTLRNTEITLEGDVTGTGPLSDPIVTELQLTLDQIKLAADNVNINNHKLINVSDPFDPLDAVNKQTLDASIDELDITLVGEVTGSGPINAPIATELQLTLDQIKLAQDTVNINDHRVTGVNSSAPQSFSDASNIGFAIALINSKVKVIWVQ